MRYYCFPTSHWRIQDFPQFLKWTWKALIWPTFLKNYMKLKNLDKEVPKGVLVLLICLQILVRLDYFSHSITMEVWKPARWKTAKIHRNEHTPWIRQCFYYDFKTWKEFPVDVYVNHNVNDFLHFWTSVTDNSRYMCMLRHTGFGYISRHAKHCFAPW